jgi:head-tail adaptor
MAKRPLDQRISFEARTAEIDEENGAVEGEVWADVCGQVFASVWEVLPQRAERLGESISTSRRLFDIEVRWGAPINGQMRVRYGDDVMPIISGPTPKGRQDRLVLICELISTEGVKP